MDDLQFQIRHADGRNETTTAKGARVVIGSGAHCDVRLAADQAAFEHVSIEELPAGLVIRCLAPLPVALLDGVPLAAQLLASERRVVVLSIGNTQLQISRGALEVAAKQAGTSPAMLGKLAVVALLAVGIVVAARSENDAPLAAPSKAPQLFEPAAKSCPRTDAAEARAVADDARALADGARERSPFDPREARSAVKSYELAAVCYRLAELPAASDDAAQSALRMREETSLDFRARRIRLERLLAVNDVEVAKQDVAVLRALTEGQQGDYPRWLETVARELKNRKVQNTQ